MYYLIFFLFIVVCCSLSLHGRLSPETKRGLQFLLFIFFWFTAGWRYETGTDYLAYVRIFDSSSDLSHLLHTGTFDVPMIEPGYLFINSIFISLGVDVNYMFLFISFCTTLLLFRSFEDYLPDYKYLGLLTYFAFIYFQMDMSGLRQAIALNVFFVALRYIYRRQFWRYTLCILLAATFHVSVIIVYPLYFFLNKKISSRLIVGTSVAGLLVIGLQLPIIGWITEYLISPLFSSNILYKVLYYTTSDIEPWPINIKVFFYLAILFVIVYNRNKLAERFPYFNIILNLLFLFVLLRIVLWESVELDMRLGFYMSLGMTMGFPLLFEIVSRKLIRQLTFVVFVFVNWYQCQNYFFSIPTFSPYQNYIVHKIFKLPSNGEERLYELMNRENND